MVDWAGEMALDQPPKKKSEEKGGSARRYGPTPAFLKNQKRRVHWPRDLVC